ncbi:Hypothetical_protein [Hexamita inflata]|uniref:Hypothetical_protein n=1 Tax=Hexamita inflata TaxID=28002 RepID=A0AA86R092_9EUKA|nr:Hypothetical protein HINF_LOCUS54868 [Hexamita inflata]
MKNRNSPKVPSRLSQIKTNNSQYSAAWIFRSQKSLPCAKLQMTLENSESESDDKLNDNSLYFLTQQIKSSIQSATQQVRRICNVDRKFYNQLQNIQILFRNQRNLLSYMSDLK